MKKPQFNNKKGGQNKNHNGFRQANFESRPKKKEDFAKVNGGVFVYSKPLTVAELSKAINVPIPAIIKFMFMNGKAVTINQLLDDEMIGTVCLEYGYDFKKEEIVDAEHFEDLKIEDDPASLVERAPVVSIMGHVDHGKTSIIDAIRHSDLCAHEAGGISQAIGAYQKEYKGKKITIIDTPGHEAFTAMRARGADATDITVLVVAADDGVMPQTVEAINHAKAAECEIIVAINKMDKPGADPDKVKNELMAHDVIAEDFGGDIMTVEVSAKTGKGINDLLDAILVKAEMMELKANPNRYAIGTVLEAKLDKGEGPKATLLVQNGTIAASDYVVVGEIYGKIRRMTNEYNAVLKSAGPSTPVAVTGLSAVPMAGDRFMAFPTEKEAKEIAERRALEKQKQERGASAAMSLNDLNNLVNAGKVQDVNIIIKADTEGSAEAMKANIEKQSNEQVKIKVLASSAGAINDSDLLLAQASHAIIYGFNIRPDARISAKAAEAGVEIRTHRIIYEVLEEIEALVKGMYKVEKVEKVTGQAEIRHIYKISKIGTIGGSYVTSGTINAGSKIRLLRAGVIVYEGELAGLKRFKDDAKEVREGYECGISIKNFNDIKEGDIVEGYEMVDKE
ncbi:MAG: translation initiation factor IF-2 [Bacilli bacterium]|nr:translation initiation factor IF-2 [Bacilli bacterium]